MEDDYTVVLSQLVVVLQLYIYNQQSHFLLSVYYKNPY